MKKLIFKDSKSLGVFLEYSLKHKFLLVTTIILTALTSALGTIPAWLSKYLIDDVFIAQSKRMLVFVVVGMVVSTVLKGLFSYLAEVRSSVVTETIRRDIKVDVFKHLMTLPISYYKKNKLGDIMARLSGDSSKLGKIGFTIFDMMKDVITALFLLGRMIQVNLVLSLIALTVLPGVMVLIKKYTKKLRRSSRKRQDVVGTTTSYIQENLLGINIIKAFSREKKAGDAYDDWSKVEYKSSIKAKKIKAKISPINEVLATLMVAMVAGYGGYLVINNRITAGELVSFITALGLMQSPIKSVVKKNNEIQEMLPSADRVLEILDEGSEIEYNGEKIEVFKDVDTVTFDKVNFSYNKESDEITIKDFSLDVKKGEVVALVGRSGSGKTTLVNLIPRFYEIDSGSIKINGVDVRNYSIREYRKKIGIVPQDTFLFSGSITSNISYGRDSVEKEEIVEAAKMANAYDFIMELDDGFNTEIGERGALLSGGQKQRIAIARALIQNPDIMILDEATSALDTESEKLVQDALDKLMIGRTTFVIAHRLSTIKNADKIVVMDKGVPVEIGNHRELMDKGGIYKKLHETQFGIEER